MRKIPLSLIKRCQSLRKRGFTLGEIVQTTGLPKTTIYGHVAHIPLLQETKIRVFREATKRINEFNIRERKGKCIPGRVVNKPKEWTDELIFLLAHFLFDGGINKSGCIYSNRSIALIRRVEDLVRTLFSIEPKSIKENPETGVYRISYFYVELADYARNKTEELLKRIQKESVERKRLFLRAFFDDEGNVSFRKKQRRVRGFQHNTGILKLVKTLLLDFGIRSAVDEKYNEIVISRREDMFKFQKEINFSRGIFLNPRRKNSIWKRELEKRQLLNQVLASYQS